MWGGILFAHSIEDGVYIRGRRYNIQCQRWLSFVALSCKMEWINFSSLSLSHFPHSMVAHLYPCIYPVFQLNQPWRV